MNENSHTYIRFLVAFLLLKFRYKEIISYNLLAEIDCPDHSYCSYWKSVGYCQYGNQYYSFLKAYCPATCGICGKYAIHVRIRPHISFSTKCGGPGPLTDPSPCADPGPVLVRKFLRRADRLSGKRQRPSQGGGGYFLI